MENVDGPKEFPKKRISALAERRHIITLRVVKDEVSRSKLIHVVLELTDDQGLSKELKTEYSISSQKTSPQIQVSEIMLKSRSYEGQRSILQLIFAKRVNSEYGVLYQRTNNSFIPPLTSDKYPRRRLAVGIMTTLIGRTVRHNSVKPISKQKNHLASSQIEITSRPGVSG